MALHRCLCIKGAVTSPAVQIGFGGKTVPWRLLQGCLLEGCSIWFLRHNGSLCTALSTEANIRADCGAKAVEVPQVAVIARVLGSSETKADGALLSPSWPTGGSSAWGDPSWHLVWQASTQRSRAECWYQEHTGTTVPRSWYVSAPAMAVALVSKVWTCTDSYGIGLWVSGRGEHPVAAWALAQQTAVAA